MQDVLKLVFAGNIEALNKACKEGANVNVKDRDGRTPVFQAISQGRPDMVEVLLQAGADVNAKDSTGETPLHFAARGQHLKSAEMLIKRGASVDAQDVHGNTPLGRAVFSSCGKGELIELLLAHGADRTLPNKRGVSPEKLSETIANYDVKQFFKKSGR